MFRHFTTGAVLLVCVSAAIAQDEGVASSGAPQEYRLSDVLFPDDSAINNAGIDFFGWIQQGFTWNPDSPANRFNGLTSFNDRANEYQVNQLYAVVERQVDQSGDHFDIGGRLDLVLGTDSRFIERQGLELHQDGTKKWNSDRRRFYDFAAPQFYADVLLPIGNGLLVRAGRFHTLHLPNESFMAPDNFFYSHSHAFIIGLPGLDHNGVLLSYPLTEQLTIEAGYTIAPVAFSPGSFDGHGFVAALNWISDDQRTQLDLAVSSDKTGFPNFIFFGNKVEGRIFTATAILRHDLTDQLRILLAGIYGKLSDFHDEFFFGKTDGTWYGASVALIYQISPTLSAGARFEWFRDKDDMAIYRFVFLPVGATDYYAATAALNWKPHPNVNIRPEVRIDTVSADFFFIDSPFDDFSESTQVTASLDVIITF